MYNYRISKYNPIYRDNEGSYRINEWTSFSDIGLIYENKKFTMDDYLKIEDAYVKTIVSFMQHLNINLLGVCELEKYEKHLIIDKFHGAYSIEIKNLYSSLQDGNILNISQIQNLSRLILREKLWCKLQCDMMYVHFGYDYYMYIGISEKCEDAVVINSRLGLFIEEYNSPYND